MQEELAQVRRLHRTDRADVRPRQRSRDRAVRRQTSRSMDRRSCSGFLPYFLRYESDRAWISRWAASNMCCTPEMVRSQSDLLVCDQKAVRSGAGRCVASTHCARGSAVEFPNDVSARSVLVPSRKIGPRRIAEALAAICSAEFVPEILRNSSSAPLPTRKSRDCAPNRVKANHRCAR